MKAEGVSHDYSCETNCFAIHGPLPQALTASVLFSFDNPDITVCRGDISTVSTILADCTVTPVYRLGQNGPLGVPTGRVFIRFQSSVRVSERRDELYACGFTIQETLSYAPHAVWVQSTDGKIATALNSLEKLHALRDVMLVEPQMLMRREQR